MYRNILLGIIVALTVILLALIFLLSNQWYYESQADEKFKKGQYEDAANLYLKALEGAKFVGQSRLLYKVGLAYQNTKDYDRARDYYFQLVQLYPDSPATKLVGDQMRIMYESESTLAEIPGLERLTGSPLEVARSKFTRSYQQLSKLLQSNRSGVPADLEAAYQAYKTYHESYKREIAKALTQWRAENPDVVWPPPGHGEGPNPTAVDLGEAARPGMAPETAPVKVAPVPSDRLNIPVADRVESRPIDVDREVTRGAPSATFAP